MDTAIGVTSVVRARLLAVGVVLLTFVSIGLYSVPAATVSICQRVDPGLLAEAIAAYGASVAAMAVWWTLMGRSPRLLMAVTTWTFLILGALVGSNVSLLYLSVVGYAPLASGLFQCSLSDPSAIAIGFVAYVPIAALGLVHVARNGRGALRYLGLVLGVLLETASLLFILTAWR